METYITTCEKLAFRPEKKINFFRENIMNAVDDFQAAIKAEIETIEDEDFSSSEKSDLKKAIKIDIDAMIKEMARILNKEVKK